ncbi:MAG TPA: hypothetical protein DCO83_10270 [Mucilaginibacter sp.]|nr:hypothetical protein [Mucilaginibacter sp.]
MGNSKTNSLNLKFQGFLVNFYPNGHKMMIRNYNNGEPLGDEIQYYPNGKLYNIRSYTKDKKVFLKQYNDSTGNVLAENGKGKWTEFDENFSEVNAEGEIENGIEAGTWHGRVDDSTNFESVFVKGKVISTTRTYKYKPNGETFTSVDIVPEFPGGLEAFARFLYRNIRYPALARENNTSGRVIVNFVVERDGSLSDVKVARGIGDGCDEEAVRIIKLSPRWKPGIQNGKPVRVSYSVPIGFSLGK